MVMPPHISRIARLAMVRVQGALATDRRERGAAMTEYGLLLILVVVASVAIIALVGGEIVGLFADSQSEFTDARDAQAS